MKNLLALLTLVTTCSTAFAAVPESAPSSLKSISCRLALKTGPRFEDSKSARATGQCSEDCQSYIDLAMIDFKDLNLEGYACSALYSPQNKGTMGIINLKIKSPTGSFASSSIKIGTMDKVDSPNMRLQLDAATCSCDLK